MSSRPPLSLDVPFIDEPPVSARRRLSCPLCGVHLAACSALAATIVTFDEPEGLPACVRCLLCVDCFAAGARTVQTLGGRAARWFVGYSATLDC